MNDGAEIVAGLKQGVLLAAAILVLVVPHVRQDVALPAPAPAAQPDFGGAAASPPVRELAAWILAAHDNAGRPFAVIDKRGAYLYVFDESGRLRASSPVLLGAAVGDDSAPGIGARPIDKVRPAERTTPAGRFAAQPGTDDAHQNVVWVDYAGGVAMHRVLLSNPAEHRLQRLASPSAAERRISYGCINLPFSFFDDVVWPMIGLRHGIVYILPEVEPIAVAFPAFAAEPHRPRAFANSD
jgi:hypothetical protein